MSKNSADKPIRSPDQYNGIKQQTSHRSPRSRHLEQQQEAPTKINFSTNATQSRLTLFIILGVALVLLGIAFFTTNWLEVERRYYGSKFKKLGLWRMCFNSFSAPDDYQYTKFYVGCRWVFADEYRPIRRYLLPAFFIATQVLFTAGFLLLVLVCAGILAVQQCFIIEREDYALRALSVASLVSAISCSSAVTIFAIYGNRQDWMPDPEHNYLSWSFAAALIGSLLLWVAALLFYIEMQLIIRRNLRQGGHSHSSSFVNKVIPSEHKQRADSNKRKREPDMMKSITTIGIEIDFPFEPYGIQRAMMGRIAATLTNKEHFLLESPTGTGKTLVLLCSTLAWQRKSKAICQPYLSERLRKIKLAERIARLKSKACSCGRRPSQSDLDELKEAKRAQKKGCDGAKFECDKLDDDIASCKRIKTEPTDKTAPRPTGNGPELITIDDDDDDDIAVIKQKTTSHSNDAEPEPVNVKGNGHANVKGDMCNSCRAIEVEEKFTEVIGDSAHDGEGIISSKIKAKIPRIYYGTRTHKQITQVIRELNKTPYKKDLKMCILSSRDRTCINESVRNQDNRNDLCQELIKAKQDTSKSSKSSECCPFYKDSNSIAVEFEAINLEYSERAWDIEDAADFGRANRVCPYYGTRSVQEQADITFCPYNYLLDPNIRKALNINLNNAIVIFDEAHNIEDICRDSASFIIDTKQIEEFIECIRIASAHYIQGSDVRDAYEFFKMRFLDLFSFLKNFQFEPQDRENGGDCINKRILANNDLRDLLSTVGMGQETLKEFKRNLQILRGDEEETSEKAKRDNSEQALSLNQLQYITQLTLALEFMYSSDNKYLTDYRLVVSEMLDRDRQKPFRGGIKSAKSTADSDDTRIWRISLLCMNSGIAFEKIHSLAWSVVVASGTLSPIESLKTELGCHFSNVFEGSHVIKKDRIHAAIISRGPNQVELNCSFQHSLKLDFQDEVGLIVKDVCQTVPNGVLCFFPSYDRMENFYTRWVQKGIMNGITRTGKKLFREGKKKSAEKFEQELKEYNELANTRGAILFAVFRGKVSEGIDFADKAARAVITIGIPYPNIKEITVGLKKDYNDAARSVRPHLMAGRDWYASQAFRALNQALGRCIRHKDDWGAIIMIDSRLNYGDSMKNISKWLRQVVSKSDQYEVNRDQLRHFVEERLAEG